MKRNRLLGGLAVIAISVLAAGQGLAQTATLDGATDPALAARQQELASITADRGRVIREIVDQWRSQFRPANPTLNDDGGVAALTGALSSATPEVLLAASRAQSYEEILALVSSRAQEPSIIALEPGQAIPNTLGSTSDDLVFTPVTPCRIIDTRLATGGWAGKVGPNSGNWFSVNLANFSTQGGATSCPGMPTTFNPGGIAINVTSTGQTGAGNLRVIACGAGTPLVSLLNYVPGVNLANAAAVSSAVGTCSIGPPAGAGPNDIYVYSTNSASDVIVDIMGYYAAPVATAVENNVLYTETNIAASTSFTMFSPGCPVGWRLTGGGGTSSSFAGPAPVGVRPVAGASQAFISGVNIADRYTCQGTNGASAQNYLCWSVCSRVPGR